MKSRSRKSEPRWKRKERSAIKALQATFGRVSDPSLARLLTSTGRVGHLTRFGVDGFVGDNPGYAVEVKARETNADQTDVRRAVADNRPRGAL
jgi:hypothetical protein